MLPQAARLKHKSDFNRVYGKGRSYPTDLVVMYVAPSRSETTRVGFSISSKVGKSVVRNRTRRLLREAVRLLLPRIKQNYDIVIVAKKKAAEADFDEICSAVEKLFRRAGLLGSAAESRRRADSAEGGAVASGSSSQ
ncbi:MAG: ribonuclease P protein component [Armatimonadota bacterium]|nr:ribonuclease P protein component [Armatimonadota bacterium]